MAKITSAITDAGGLIVAFDTFLGQDSGNWGCTVKVADITKDALLAAIEEHVVQVVDIRQT